MIVFYGAGKFLKDVVDNDENKNVDKIVDSDLSKVGMRVGGHIVESAELVKSLGEADVVYITTGLDKFMDVMDMVKKMNPNVTVWHYYGKKFFEESMPMLDRRKKIRKEYSGATEEQIRTWVDESLAEEVPWWDKRMDEIRVYLKDRFSKRGFDYYYCPANVKEGDVVLDVGCGPIPKYGTIVNNGEIKYFPLDSLAYQYNRLADKHQLSIPVKPRFAVMEMLSSFFGENYADYIIINNAMDHCADILRTFIEAIKSLKMGGALVATAS